MEAWGDMTRRQKAERKEIDAIADRAMREVRKRHNREKLQAVGALNEAGLTQTQAARKLRMKKTTLNNFIQRSGIAWKVIKQGVRQ